MKGWWKCLVVFLLATLASGCWDLHELNDIGIITGMGIDKGSNHHYRLTIEDINTTELAGPHESGSSPVVIFSQEGDALPEIRYRMNVGISRKLIFSHMRVLAVSDAVAKEGIKQFLDFMERDREIRDDFRFVIVKNTSAENAIRTTYPIQKIPSLKVYTQIDTMLKEWGGDTDIQLNKMIAALTSPGREPVAELISFQGNPTGGTSTENNKDLTPKTIVTLHGMALFKQDKMIGELPLKDVRNYLWIENEITNTSLTVPDAKDHFLSVRVSQNQTKINATYDNGIPIFEINVKFQGLLEETQINVDMTKADTYRLLEQKTNEFVEKQLLRTIRTVQQKYGVDSFGFGEDMYRQDPAQFNRVRTHWNEEFQKAKIVVHADCHLRRSGIRTKSFLDEMK